MTFKTEKLKAHVLNGHQGQTLTCMTCNKIAPGMNQSCFYLGKLTEETLIKQVLAV